MDASTAGSGKRDDSSEGISSSSEGGGAMKVTGVTLGRKREAHLGLCSDLGRDWRCPGELERCSTATGNSKQIKNQREIRLKVLQGKTHRPRQTVSPSASSERALFVRRRRWQRRGRRWVCECGRRRRGRERKGREFGRGPSSSSFLAILYSPFRNQSSSHACNPGSLSAILRKTHKIKGSLFAHAPFGDIQTQLPGGRQTSGTDFSNPNSAIYRGSKYIYILIPRTLNRSRAGPSSSWRKALPRSSTRFGVSCPAER